MQLRGFACCAMSLQRYCWTIRNRGGCSDRGLGADRSWMRVGWRRSSSRAATAPCHRVSRPEMHASYRTTPPLSPPLFCPFCFSLSRCAHPPSFARGIRVFEWVPLSSTTVAAVVKLSVCQCGEVRGDALGRHRCDFSLMHWMWPLIGAQWSPAGRLNGRTDSSSPFARPASTNVTAGSTVRWDQR